VLVPVWASVLQLRGHWADSLDRRPLRSWATTALVATVASIFVVYLVKSADVSRTLVGGYTLAASGALWGVRAVLRALWVPAPWHVVLVGSDAACVAHERHLRDGVVVVSRAAAASGVWDAVRAGAVDEVRYLERRGPGELESLAGLCSELGMTLSVAPTAWGPVTDRGDVALRFAPAGGGAMVVKRCVDVVLGSVLLVLAAPVVAALALAVARDGHSPWFRQVRAGRHGRPFRMWKLRTMVPDAASRRAELDAFNEVAGPAFKMRRDPRVTPLGHWLRRWSLDELPQLWHVVRGEMSLVGPRPALPDEVARYTRAQRRRLAMRPGLTCIWQVSGRSDLDWDTWMRMDLAYVDEWSPWLDLWLLLRTVPAVLTGRGAR
jgi:lipopolysaccharide/colanic/teichoic acid biosynthesis glycosyltransferase